METETIDRLYTELSQFTTAKTARELALEAAIKAALKVSSLWVPIKDYNLYVYNPREQQVLIEMYETFKGLVDG